MKIKLKSIGVRVVYQLFMEDSAMKIVIVPVRADEKVYKEAIRRISE